MRKAILKWWLYALNLPADTCQISYLIKSTKMGFAF